MKREKDRRSGYRGAISQKLYEGGEWLTRDYQNDNSWPGRKADAERAEARAAYPRSEEEIEGGRSSAWNICGSYRIHAHGDSFKMKGELRNHQFHGLRPANQGGVLKPIAQGKHRNPSPKNKKVIQGRSQKSKRGKSPRLTSCGGKKRTELNEDYPPIFRVVFDGGF